MMMSIEVTQTTDVEVSVSVDVWVYAEEPYVRVRSHSLKRYD